MSNSLFFSNIQESDKNKDILAEIESYSEKHPLDQLYLINSALSEKKYEYEYQDHVIVLLSPKHKILFVNMGEDDDSFEEFCDEFIEDLGYISDKYDYRSSIGRPKKWESELTVRLNYSSSFDILSVLNENIIDSSLRRKNELLISLLVGSINDIEKIGLDEPSTLLEKIKNKIVLFDGEQTRFIYKKLDKKIIYIQGLSGTGKTELLLHKLKEIYLSTDDTKIFLTCHNIALANTLKKRIPKFFNFMKIDKQIDWNERLWVDRAWGSMNDKNSGLYSYICSFYGISFKRWSRNTTYTDIFKSALEVIENIKDSDFKYAFDYILIDERQDFPDVFFNLCEKITKEKVYIAGDIFQDIFEHDIEKKIVDVDFILNKCYRTDPRTLMFAHAVGMGLFEENKLNWLSDKEWLACGYIIDRDDSNIYLSRDPIRRFEDLDTEEYISMDVREFNDYDQIISIINEIKDANPTLKPEDIAIITLDNNSRIFDLINAIEFKIRNELGWEVNKAYESKEIEDDKIFISNRNNVKGLEFPFVICLTNGVDDTYSYRNTFYTMITRSFIKSYLLINNISSIEKQITGLEIINEKKCIKASEPSDGEIDKIKKTIIQLKADHNISYKDLLANIFTELEIDNTKCMRELEKHIPEKIRFDRDEMIRYIEANKGYYC